MVNVFTPFGGVASNLANLLIKPSTGISLVGGSAVYTGANGASSTFDSLELGGAKIAGPGILLTSGDGTPPLTNTFSGYGVGLGQNGDNDLTQIVQTAFPGAGTTRDASVLEFKINADKGVKTVIFDVVFASDEYSEFSSSSFVDIAAILVNGKNAALFAGDPKKPLSVLDPNLGYFQDNEAPAVIGIEYDGISNKLTVIAKVKEGENTIKIAIADTGDGAYDSAIFIANLRGSDKDLEGILNEIIGTIGNDKLKAIPDIDNVVIGGLGKDKLFANTGFDILYGDEEDSGTDGTGKSLDEISATGDIKDVFVFKSVKMLEKSISKTDVIADFDSKDKIDISKMTGPKFEFIGKSKFSGDGPEVAYKAFKSKDYTAVYIDKNGDGKADATIKLLGIHKLTDGDFSL